MTSIAITVQDEQVRQQLAKLIATGRDQTTAMRRVARTLEDYVRNTFRDQRDPWGNGWAAHSNVTLLLRKRANNPSVQKLIGKTRQLYASIHAESDEESASVVAGDNGSEPYAQVQQYGNPNNKMFGKGNAPIPARPYFPSRSPGEDAFPPDWLAAVLVPIENAFRETAP